MANAKFTHFKRNLPIFNWMIKLLYVISFIISLWFSIQFWSNFGSSIIHKMSFFMFALILDGTKIVCFSLLGKCFDFSFAKKSIFIFFGVILFSISIISTIAQFSSYFENSFFNKNKNSQQTMILNNSINTYQNHIDVLMQSVRVDMLNGYTTRAQNNLKVIIPKMQNKLDGLRNEYLEGGMDALHDSPGLTLSLNLSKLISCPVDTLNVILSIFFGVLLELCCMVLILAMGCDVKLSSLRKLTTAPITKKEFRSKKTKEINFSTIESHLIPLSNKTNDAKSVFEYQRLKRLIISKRCFPSVSNIKEAMSIEENKILMYLNLLKIEGVF